ncbi:aminopeptidase [Rhodoferax koreense]|uniref:Aminopeptidase n=1 Tax=Rhodoferax koreensis TaxID=1842727 RepID=A0A1P8JRX2_9BURK|nr:aminopeptidase [Rhodoferax koreense]APW36513.1 aminopeptidase [Rhodoferax koreense]
MSPFLRVAIAGLCVALLAGCADTAYLLQSARGHLQMLRAARPIDAWLADAETPADLKQRLVLARQMRSFAVSELRLPDNASYHRYADLHRRAVVWNVVAAPPYSLKLKTWCFPVTGCIGYRGYFDEADAKTLATQLDAEGLETGVYGVPAYSTLGWMNWAGGDPLLNTFIRYPEGELSRMLFHELAHQVVYVQDDTPFNESFATAVERLGGARWLAERGSEAARREYAEFDGRRRQFRALMLATRQRLAAIYKENDAKTQTVPAQAALKNEAMVQFRADYAALKASWHGFAGYDGFVQRANNAMFGVQAAYDGLVPAFEALFAREGGDWPKFYDAVKRLAALPKAERTRALQQLSPLEPPGA